MLEATSKRVQDDQTIDAGPRDGLKEAKMYDNPNALVARIGARRLILSRCGDLAFYGEVCYESFDLGARHGIRMPFAVEEDEVLHPAEVSLLGADAIGGVSPGLVE